MSRNIIAYSPNNNLFIIFPSFLSIIMNVLFILNFILKIYLNKGKNRMSSLEKLLLPLSILESLISICWFLSGKLFGTKEEIDNKKEECKIFAAFQIFCYMFDWLLVHFTLSHLKNMILNPLNYILKSKKKITHYLLISGGFALIFSIISYFMGYVGKSPMLTCFLSIEFYNDGDINNTKDIIGLIIVGLICSIPVIILIIGIINSIVVCSNISYKHDKENRIIFQNHSLYLFIYLIMTFLITTLYVIEFIKKGKIENVHLENYFFAISLIICITPLIVGVIRFYQTKIIRTILKEIKNKCFPFLTNNEEESLHPLIENESTFEQFESLAIKKFVMNIYIALCFCLEKKLNEEDINYNDLNEKMNNETNRYKISKKDLNKQLENGQLVNDRLIKMREDFSITCVEYAPKIFKYLRQLDGIKEDVIVRSMLPMNNKIGITETEGRGGSFFVNSDDHEFILKTITLEELELMRKYLLFKLAQYLHENNDSIISRVYGVYKITMQTGIFKESEIYFILMRNVIGSFYDNLICKYDLKGSSLNRKVKYENVDKNVMKDINFNEAEQVFLLSKNDSKKLLDIAKRDANFFCSSGIMDYSLLVVKISLNKDEINYLFGKDHRKKLEKEFCDMAGVERIPSINTNDINDVVELSIKNDKNGKKVDIEDNEEKLRFSDTKIESLKKYFFPSLKGDVLYIMSIIDFFQLYNLQKNIETKYKQITARVKAKYISSLPPIEYKDRFIEFIQKKTDSEKYIKEIYDPENTNDF